MAETIYVQGEGGSVFAMDLPLPEALAARLAAGQLRRVNPDGSPYREPSTSPPPDGDLGAAGGDGAGELPPAGGAGDPTPPAGTGAGDPPADPPPPPPPPPVPGAQLPELPARNAATGAWRTWAVQHGGLSQEEANQLSRDELVELLSPPVQPAE